VHHPLHRSVSPVEYISFGHRILAQPDWFLYLTLQAMPTIKYHDDFLLDIKLPLSLSLLL
jgi:hypothetical protein